MHTILSAALVMLLSVTLWTISWAGEEKIPLDNLPKTVTVALAKRLPKGELKSAEKEVEDGTTTYEVTVIDNKIRYEVEITAEGFISGLEKEVPIADLPKVVSDAVKAKYPKGTLTKAEAVIKVKDGKEVLECYEVRVNNRDKMNIEVEVLPDGKLKPADKE